MKLRNILIAGAIFGVGYYIYKKKSLGNNARFSFDAIKLSGTNIIVTLGILNAVNSTAILKSMVGDLSINGEIIATGSTFDAVTIKPNTKTQFNITFVPSATGILSTLKNIIKKGLKNIKAKFVGTANINGFNMPIDLTYGA
jgi:LEA14-like dessication related protein